MLRKTMLALAFVSAALALVLLGVVGGKLSVSARTGAQAHATAASTTQAAPAPLVGELAGTTAEGMPVYRLPPIAVTATRGEVLARIDREGRQATEGAVHPSATFAQTPQRDVRAAAPGSVVR